MERVSMNVSERIPYVFCDCHHFSKFLMNLTSATLSRDNIASIWLTFKETLEEHWNMFTVPQEAHIMMPCSLKVCLALLKNIEELPRGVDSLSTLLNSINSIIYLSENECCSSVRYIQNLIHFCRQSSTVQGLVALRGRCVYMKLLLNFGLVKKLPQETSFLRTEAHQYIRDFISTITPRGNRVLNFLANKTLNTAKHAFFRSKNHRCYKRIFLASVAIKAISLKLMDQHDLAYSYINCLRIYFTATSDTLLSVSEVKNLLYGCCTILKTLRFYDDFCQEFDELMPECPTRLEPRRLTDLARYQIRQNLSNCNLPLPQVIELFEIPKRVKNFVLGDLIDISSNRKFTIIRNKVEIIDEIV